MTSSGETWIFWILGAVFLALGVHLYLYGRRRTAMIRRFAKSNGLLYRERLPESFEEELTETFRPSVDGHVRAFMRVRDVAGDSRVRLFKCVELLDLSRWGRAQSTHFPRIAAHFPVAPRYAHWALYHPGGSLLRLIESPDDRDPAWSRAMEDILAANPPKHSLSITFARGQGLAYLKPLRIGSEREADLLYLLELSRLMADRFEVARREKGSAS